MKYTLAFLILFACKSVVPPQVTTNTMDSTMVEVRERVDTLWMAGEVLEVPVYIECDSLTNKPKPFKQKKVGKNVSATANLDKKGLLTLTCKEDSLMVVTKKLDSIVFRLRHEDKTITLPPVVTHTPHWFDIGFRWWALVTALYLAWTNRKGVVSLLGKLLR